MSIAVSVTIPPSRILAGMLVFMFGLANIAIGYAGFCTDLNKITISAMLFLSSLLSLTMFLQYYRRQRSVRLDISESGNMIFRILETNSSYFDSLNVRLSERSTLWPHLMLLSLCSDDGQNIVLPILRDSVDAETY
ncbi:MAG: protein YgfX, partial [Pseudomonadota bacterium]